MHWDDLKFWDSGECQVVEERLADLDKAKKAWNPGKKNLYRALDLTPFEKVKVVLLGQDPYPRPEDACGLAFSSPISIPPSLDQMFKELVSDLGVPYPKTGNLEPWAKQGVLLWNAIPSCLAGVSSSHDWPEWEYLTGEILKTLSTETSAVFVAMGQKAQQVCLRHIKEEDSVIIKTTHPSPRATLASKIPFLGCRLFSTVNTELRKSSLKTIDWRL